MLSIIIFAILFIIGIILLIKAIIGYKKEQERINKYMLDSVKRYQEQMKYWEMYNQCKKQQEELLKNSES